MNNKLILFARTDDIGIDRYDIEQGRTVREKFIPRDWAVETQQPPRATLRSARAPLRARVPLWTASCPIPGSLLDAI
jgi:hypothetical protein